MIEQEDTTHSLSFRQSSSVRKVHRSCLDISDLFTQPRAVTGLQPFKIPRVDFTCGFLPDLFIRVLLMADDYGFLTICTKPPLNSARLPSLRTLRTYGKGTPKSAQRVL